MILYSTNWSFLILPPEIFFTDAIGASSANFSEIWTKNYKQKSVNKMHVEKQFNNVGHFGPQCV